MPDFSKGSPDPFLRLIRRVNPAHCLASFHVSISAHDRDGGASLLRTISSNCRLISLALGGGRYCGHHVECGLIPFGISLRGSTLHQKQVVPGWVIVYLDLRSSPAVWVRALDIVASQAFRGSLKFVNSETV
jgi:hypothetical protein